MSPFHVIALLLGLLMVQYLTGGAWGIMIRRQLEAGAKTLWVFVLLLLPHARPAPRQKRPELPPSQRRLPWPLPYSRRLRP